MQNLDYNQKILALNQLLEEDKIIDFDLYDNLIEKLIAKAELSNFHVNIDLIKRRKADVDIVREKIDLTNVKPVLTVKNFTKHYPKRDKPAVNNVSFNIYPGQFHAFIGANGAGKTTTIKSIIGAYSSEKYKGDITIFGKHNETVAAKRRIGYIPEVAKFPKKISTFDYLLTMCMLSGYTKNDAEKLTKDILKRFNISSLAKKNPESFSSGQKKKILLAQALIHDPDVLILDEPAANLDPLAREELFNLLYDLQTKGKSIFISSHILDEIGKYATYSTILDGGKVVFDGPIHDIPLSHLYKKYVKFGSVDEKRKEGKSTYK